MKAILTFLFFVANFATAAIANDGYQPWRFQCVYDASSDGMITATSKINPDRDDWTFTLKSSKGSEVSELEALSAYVYGKTEKIEDVETSEAIAHLAKMLKIDRSQWFSTTDITVPLGPAPMRFFKFNSEDGTLGIGVYVKVSEQKHFVNCALSK